MADSNFGNPPFGGIEAGGTKFVCAVGTGPDDILGETRFPTTGPEETLGRAVAFFRDQEKRFGRISAIGIGAFGPADVDPRSRTWGFVTETPKPGWANTDVARTLSRALGVPAGFDTDVNAAALGERTWGNAMDVETFIYLTVGTGIGGGGMAAGRLLHGLMHPEMGHIRVPRGEETFAGICPYHGDCLEGLASGPAIRARWGVPAEELPEGHPAWDLEARYLALAISNYLCTISPERVILGGGVMQSAFLFPRIREQVQTLLGGYIRAPQLAGDIDRFIVPPALGGRAGVLGAFVLARNALSDS